MTVYIVMGGDGETAWIERVFAYQGAASRWADHLKDTRKYTEFWVDDYEVDTLSNILPGGA